MAAAAASELQPQPQPQPQLPFGFFPPQPLNFENEAGILRDLPSSPPTQIHKLIIDVDDLSPNDFIRLNALHCHRTHISEWILGVGNRNNRHRTNQNNNNNNNIGFSIVRLFSLMKLFRPTNVMIRESADILLSHNAFLEFISSSPQLSLLVIDCDQDFSSLASVDTIAALGKYSGCTICSSCSSSLSPWRYITDLRVNIAQDVHVETLSNLASLLSPTTLCLWISHGLTQLESLVLPVSVKTLALNTQQLPFLHFQQLARILQRHDHVTTLRLRWKGSQPRDLLGLISLNDEDEDHHCQHHSNIRTLDLKMNYCGLSSTSSSEQNHGSIVSTVVKPFLKYWMTTKTRTRPRLGTNALQQLRLMPNEAASRSTMSSSNVNTNSQWSVSDYQELVDFFTHEVPPSCQLKALVLRIPLKVLPHTLSDSMIRMVQSIPTLRNFTLATTTSTTTPTASAAAAAAASSQGHPDNSSDYYARRYQYHCDLHWLPARFLSLDTSRKLWPHILARAAASSASSPSVLYYLLHSKNHFLIPTTKQNKKRKIENFVESHRMKKENRRW